MAARADENVERSRKRGSQIECPPDEDELTLKEIGDKYNLSRERIRQLQEQALGKMRKQMKE